MRTEVRNWVQAIVAEYRPQGPVLEVGGLNVNGTVRDLFPQEGYLSLDKRPGLGVDVVADICNADFDSTFNTVVCCETLEHIERPWEAFNAMRRVLADGGLFIGTAVFAFPIHNEPEDYWRVTPAAFRLLLEDAGFTDIRIDTEGDGPIGVFAVARA
jgi:SAM-dependent methyltransferase